MQGALVKQHAASRICPPFAISDTAAEDEKQYKGTNVLTITTCRVH
jgi:hypothetical protein